MIVTVRSFLLLALMCAGTYTTKAANIIWPAVGLAGWVSGYYMIGSDVSPIGYAGLDMLLTATAPDTATLSAQTYTAGNVAIWFQTSLNSAVDANAVSSASYFCNPLTGTLGSIDVSIDQVFYIGFLLWGPDNIYGWASLIWDGTTLTLLDSAAETTGVGIFAGTYDPVPEPSAGCLLAAGLTALALRRRRRRV